MNWDYVWSIELQTLMLRSRRIMAVSLGFISLFVGGCQTTISVEKKWIKLIFNLCGITTIQPVRN